MEKLPAVKKKGLLILYVSVMLLMLTACQKDAGSIVPETRTITDMAGREVTIPSEVNRICSSGTAQNQLMMFLGEGDKICATLAGFYKPLGPESAAFHYLCSHAFYSNRIKY